MGGIAGMVHFRKNFIAYKSYNTLLVRDMAECLASPEAAAGEWVGEHAAVACQCPHTAGKQPLSRIVGGYEFVLVFDGVLRDTAGIRRELGRFGYRFETGGDAELLLYAYIHYGAECARLLEGSYAFCVWDSMRQRVFACRDRVGAKPFYYTYQEESFLFGSAVRALFRHPSVSPCIDADSLRAVFSTGAVWPQGGVFAGVEELLPGHTLILDRAGLHCRPYWELPRREHTESAEDTARHLSALLDESIGREMEGALPAVILTGRPGSNLLAALAARQTDNRLATCSFAVKKTGRYYKPKSLKHGADQLYVERMIEELDSCHHYYSATPAELHALLPETVKLLDMPGLAFDDAALLCFLQEMGKEHAKILCAAGAGVCWGQELTELRPDTGLSALLLPAVAETLDLEGYTPAASRYPVPWLTPLLVRLARLSGDMELRLPFCSREILEYALNIPKDIQKEVINLTASPVLPADVLAHESPYRPCVNSACYAELLKNSVLAVLEDSRAPALAFFDRTAVLDAAEKMQNSALTEQGLSAAEQLSVFLQINNWLALYNPRLI